MPDFSTIHTASNPKDDTVELTRLREHLTPLLSVIAGIVDLIGFFTLGNMSLMEVVRKRHSLTGTELTRLKGSLRLLVGFLVGCLVAAAAGGALQPLRPKRG